MRYSLFILIILLVVSCSSPPPVPTDRFYRLSIEENGTNHDMLTEDIIFISSILAEGLYNERALLYTGEGGKNELQQFHYHFWVTSPPKLIQENLIKYLRLTNASPMLVNEAGSGEKIKISGRLHAFEKIDSGESARANISIEFTVADRGIDTPLLIREYHTTEGVEEKTVPALVDAYNRAINRIFAEFRTDLAAVL